VKITWWQPAIRSSSGCTGASAESTAAMMARPVSMSSWARDGSMPTPTDAASTIAKKLPPNARS
jgi:hypothetical protein